jgi:UDP-N-acetylmuramyl pentapeptide phosphotransferase/UDP-N-acetylglucosamine-1-phosphate transferase
LGEKGRFRKLKINGTHKREIRKFGGIAFCFFGILCSLGIWRERIFIIYFFGVLSLLGLGLMILPVQLRWIYRLWLFIAHYIGKIITILVLALAYYLVITPAAFLKRVFGGRPLPMRHDKNVSTYWVTRPEAAQPLERFTKRF